MSLDKTVADEVMDTLEGVWVSEQPATQYTLRIMTDLDSGTLQVSADAVVSGEMSAVRAAELLPVLVALLKSENSFEDDV